MIKEQTIYEKDDVEIEVEFYVPDEKLMGEFWNCVSIAHSDKEGYRSILLPKEAAIGLRDFLNGLDL